MCDWCETPTAPIDICLNRSPTPPCWGTLDLNPVESELSAESWQGAADRPRSSGRKMCCHWS